MVYGLLLGTLIDSYFGNAPSAQVCKTRKLARRCVMTRDGWNTSQTITVVTQPLNFCVNDLCSMLATGKARVFKETFGHFWIGFFRPLSL